MKAAASARPLPLSPLLDALRHTLPNFGASAFLRGLESGG